MNKLVGIAILAIIVGGVSVYAVSPYFTESTIDESIPTGAIIQSEIKNNDMIVSHDKESVMEEEAMMMEEVIPVSYAGTFVGVGDGIHDAQGNVFTIPLEDNSNILRLENFKSTNGPDLYVYLATDDNASEFINLGELKANNGNQNYEIPENSDLNKYNKVLVWCKAFGVLFGSAELSTQ
ncbi:hypothetical protein C5F47_01170 [Nitrosopumilus cobalaminigenes]|uniref:DM13 domain-containing protein n=1 Tax=Nitrosopumilus cobalaminigenes TaxID=1470066 RepID=A0A7D5R007_9ARCH|nr:DM13 domain-containing protein [Nitrosopumilus cobalaminigenes]QLH02277.1 hypothetical protein C5F47_01170 [Nitrosopumilus cobalaminigenes]